MDKEQAVREDMKKVSPIYREWLSNRKEAKKQLLLLADKINKHNRNTNIAKVTGTSACVVGVGLAVGGFVSAFFTFGASLIVSGVAIGINSAGGLTTAGSGIVLYLLNRNIFKNAQKAIDRDQELTNKLTTSLNDLSQETLRIMRDQQELEMSIMDTVLLTTNAGRLGKIISKDVIYDFVAIAKLVKIAARTVDKTAATTAFRVMSGVSRVFHIAGFAIGLALLPFDLYTLVTSSISLHKGNTSDAEEKIREIVKEMVCDEKEKEQEKKAEMKREEENYESPKKKT